MKLTCEKEILLNLLTTTARAIPSKSANPLLEGVLITAEQDTLTLTGYDTTMGIRTTTITNIIEPGCIVLNARLLLDIIRKLPQSTVEISTDAQLITTIQCDKSIFSLAGIHAEEYPHLDTVSEQIGFTMPQTILKSMIAQTIFSISENQAKPIHTGCLFETDDRLHVVAVDGYRLSIRCEAIKDLPAGLRFVVPGNSLREIEKILSVEEGKMVEIYPDKKNILFRMGNTTLITRLLEGEFLNYRSTIPTQFAHTIKVRRNDLITCIERVSLIISERLKNPVRLQFDGDYIKLSCITSIGKSYDECPIEGEVNHFEIGLNNHYILDALRSATEEQVVLQMNSPLNPIVITPPEGNAYTYLVLPVRLKTGE